jgi:dolichyl-phosphate-mannose-protein mannosyltransferase
VFGDYFNFLSVFSSVSVLIALFILIPLGLFLCKYSMKFITVSLVGLILTTVYISQLIIVDVNLLKNSGHYVVGLILGDAVPVCFFIAAALGIIRWGLQIWFDRARSFTRSFSPALQLGKSAYRERIRQILRWFRSLEGKCICVIEASVLAVHLMFIGRPAAAVILDEVYYVHDAKNLLYGLSMNYPEHPPLGKLLIASGIFVFGDNPVGWRIISIIFSLAGIFIFYLICKKLTAKWFGAGVFVPLLAVFLLATENLSFVIGHIAMLDVFYVTFMLLGFLFYLNGKYTACGIAMGLSLLCKESAVLGIMVVVLHWVITHRREIAGEMRNTINALQGKEFTGELTSNFLNLFKMLVIIAAVWLILIVPLEYSAMHQYPASTLWYNPLFRAIYMLWHPLSQTFTNFTSLTAGTAGSWLVPTPPWQWLLWPGAAIVYGTDSVRYLGSIGWAVWPLIIPSIVYLVYESIRNRFREHNIAFFLLCWLVGVYGMLVVLTLLTDRLSYEYYFYPAVPAVCLSIACGIWKLWELARGKKMTRVIFRAGLAFYLLAVVVVFIIMSPFGTNLVKLP